MTKSSLDIRGTSSSGSESAESYKSTTATQGLESRRNFYFRENIIPSRDRWYTVTACILFEQKPTKKIG